MYKFFLWCWLILLTAVACQAPEPIEPDVESASTPATSIADADTVVSEATATEGARLPTPTTTFQATEDGTAASMADPKDNTNYVRHAGVTADGLFYRGNVDAPVTIIDFSDFL